MRNYTVDNKVTNKDIDKFVLGFKNLRGKPIKLLSLLRMKSILRKRLQGISLESIAKDFYITRERIRQKEKEGVNLILVNKK